MFTLLFYLFLLNLTSNFIQISLQFNYFKDDQCDRTVDVYETVVEPKLSIQNRNKPIRCVYTIQIKPHRDDWLIYIRFTKFKIGSLSEDRSNCLNGYIQIIDGYSTNNSNSGYFCGEMDMPKTLISETPFVKVIFYASNFDENSFFKFSTEIQTREEHWTKLGVYGQVESKSHDQVKDSFCDKLIQDCPLGGCFIHSPGFPQVYPRNLSCHYMIDLKSGLVGLEFVVFEVDGEECESSIFCLPKPITTDPRRCLHDYLRVYDGPDQNSPIITTICGRGSLEPNIVSSSSTMLIEFVSSPAGHLADTGFKLKIESYFMPSNLHPIQLSKNGSCKINKILSGLDESVTFTSIKSWYPPNTTCAYIFTAPNSNDQISLKFHAFLIDTITLCEESLQIYDASEPDPHKLLTILCDTNRPLAGQEMYITTGPSLLLQFTSRLGSLQGSSINYHFTVKRIEAEKKTSSSVITKSCSKTFTPTNTLNGSFTLHPKQFNKSLEGQFKCNLTFDASLLLHGRVNLTMISAFDTALTCEKHCEIEILSKDQPKLMIYQNLKFLATHPPFCFCQPFSSPFYFDQSSSSLIEPKTISIISNSSSLTLSILLPHNWGQKSDSIPIQVFYRFMNENRCGPQESFKSFRQLQGRVQFPFYTHFHGNSAQNTNHTKSANYLEVLPLDTSPLFCKWSIYVSPNFDVSFSLKNINLPLDCSDNFILVQDTPFCGSYHYLSNSLVSKSHSESSSKTFVSQANIIIKKEDVSVPNTEEIRDKAMYSTSAKNDRMIDIFFSSTQPEVTSFDLYWTQLKLLPETVESSEQLTSISRECDFFCKSSRTCIHSSMVCNQFPNCPLVSTNEAYSEDEDEALCTKSNILVSFFSNKYLILGLALFLLIFLSSIIIFFFTRLMSKYRRNIYYSTKSS